jgi:hypothetical protein
VKWEDQPHAKQIAHASEPALWGTDAELAALPIPRNAERQRPLPDARRTVSGRTEGE